MSRIEQLASSTVLAVMLAAAFAPVLAPYDPTQPHYDDTLVGPSLEYPLGTDFMGADLFSQLLYGARISLIVGLGAVLIALVIGVTIGSIAGYIGGRTDDVMMRFMDVILSFPTLILAIILVGVLEASLRNMILVISIVYTPQYARLIRGEVLSVKEESYIEAAVNTGISDFRILTRHVIPNSFAPVIVQGTFHIALAIIFEASLSFLGLGVSPPTQSWGLIIAGGRQYLPEAWWITTFPGIFIFITVISFNLLGDSLQDRFDPKSDVNLSSR